MSKSPNTLLQSLPLHVREAIEKASTSQLSEAALIDSIQRIYTTPKGEGLQMDALAAAIESHTLASQLDVIDTILRGIKLADPHSHFLISAFGMRLAERAATQMTRLETLLTLFPT